jgi:hypothetical protein
MDRRDVQMVSTDGTPRFHAGKPAIIQYYNETMKGVDLTDQFRHGKQLRGIVWESIRKYLCT